MPDTPVFDLTHVRFSLILSGRCIDPIVCPVKLFFKTSVNGIENLEKQRDREKRCAITVFRQ